MTYAKYSRPSPQTAPTAAKAAGLYMICTISKHMAEREGYADALMLDWRGYIAEATGANIFLIRDGVIHTPTPDCFLDGITRNTVIALAREKGFEVVERHHPADRGTGHLLAKCSSPGTAAEVTPVGEIGEHRYTAGHISLSLMDDYAQHGSPDQGPGLGCSSPFSPDQERALITKPRICVSSRQNKRLLGRRLTMGRARILMKLLAIALCAVCAFCLRLPRIGQRRPTSAA